MTVDLAISKLQKYCAYQERCHQEVRTKLLKLEVYGADLEYVISNLVSDDFLNESRFAEAYARGKFRINKWGRVKIRLQLQARKVSAYDIREALAGIDDDEYLAALTKLLHRKNELLNEADPFRRRNSLFRFAANKGYESSLITGIISDLVQ